MAKCFLITGGGTGAKVLEALIHLGAAGAAADEIHILIVDADTTNGNVSRTEETLRAYNQLQPWGWSLRPATGDPLHFFRSKIFPYVLKERIMDVLGGSLLQNAGNDEELKNILNLLYDRDEQESRHEVGFLARSNLGCLVLAEHLDQNFRGMRANQQPRDFIRTLRDSLRAREETRVVVVGSIFGGTGASLLPVAKQCVLTALHCTEQEQQFLQFAAVMMMPYFSPREKLKSVDPQRFLLDTALALQYYGLTGFDQDTNYDTLYLIGSDKPGRASHQLPIPVGGGIEQRNPPFVEELVAGLAIADFCARGAAGGERVRIYERKSEDPITWDHVPLTANGPREPRIAHLSYLLHTAAFYLRLPSGTGGKLSAGLHELINHTPGSDLRYFPWFDALLHPWAQSSHKNYAQLGNTADRWDLLQEKIGAASGTKLQPALSEYFVRLLGWAYHALEGDGLDLINAPEGSSKTLDYARLYSAMCDVETGEFEQEGLAAPYSEDNTAARLVRAALLGMDRVERASYKLSTKKVLGEDVPLRRRTPEGKFAIIPLLRWDDFRASAERVGKGNVLDEYVLRGAGGMPV